MISSIFINTVLAAVLIAALTAPLGNVVLWQRISFFGDALAHSLTLGIALNIVLFSGFSWGIFITGFVFVGCIIVLHNTVQFAPTTALSIVSHSLLALGILVMYLFSPYAIDLHGLFFGDLLSIRRIDLLILGSLFVGIGIFFVLFWKKLLLICLDAALAQAEGIPVRILQSAFLALLTLAVMIIIQMTGILLVTSILIIPAATARNIAPGPKTMMLFTGVVSVAVVVLGVCISFVVDVPLPPMIIVLYGVVFLISLIFQSKRRLQHQ